MSVQNAESASRLLVSAWSSLRSGIVMWLYWIPSSRMPGTTGPVPSPSASPRTTSRIACRVYGDSSRRVLRSASLTSQVSPREKS